MSARASYDLKLDRAEHHLNKLERAITRFSDRHPYRVREQMNQQGDFKLYFLEFTEDPPENIALIIGDFLYNTRAALDHIAGRLVPSKHRGHANFPVLWQGVWEASVKGEGPQNTRDRAEWVRCTEGMPDDAIAIIAINQPPKLAPNVHNANGLAILNRLRNRDAHAQLTVIAHRLMNPIGRCDMPDGSTGELRPANLGTRMAVEPGLIGNVPNGAMNVEFVGTIEIMIRAGLVDGGYSVRETFRPLTLDGSRNLLDALRPFTR